MRRALDTMGVQVTFSGQEPELFQKAAGFYEAIAIARTYLEQHPAHEVLIGSTVTSMPRETAAALLKRIDDAVPAPSDRRMSFDPEVVDAIHLEVGLEPRFKKVTPEATTAPASKREKQPS